MTEHVYILLPVHNRRETTMRCAEALRRQTYPSWTLVLLDDGSSDGTAEAVCRLLPRTIVQRGDGTWWWSGCMQQGFEWLRAGRRLDDDIVLLLNDDLAFDPEFIASAVAELRAQRDTLLLARQVDAATGAEIGFGGGVHADVLNLRFTETADPVAVNCLPTRGLFIRWRDLQRLGGFRCLRVRHYLADYELTYRAFRAGMSLRVSDRVTVRSEAGTSGLTREAIARLPRRHRLPILWSHRFKENPRDWLGFAWAASPLGRRPYLTAKILVNTLKLWLAPGDRSTGVTL